MSYPRQFDGLHVAECGTVNAVRRPMDVDVRREGRGYAVRVRRGEEARSYRFASEAQARYFAAVCQLGPDALPDRALFKKAPARRRRRVITTDNAVAFEGSLL